MMEWSDMLPEVLDIIAHKSITCYEDYPSFAGVCKSWRLAAARTYHNTNGPPSRLPSLMLAEKSDDQESRELFLLSNKSIRKIRLPEAYGKVCGSSCGWLVTVGRDFDTQLINPLSGEIFNLPKAENFRKSWSPPHWDVVVLKVVLVIPSKLVLILNSCSGKLAFCHIGDDKWTSVEQRLYSDIRDITFYNGQVYTLQKKVEFPILISPRDILEDDDKVIRACNVNGKDPTVLVDVSTTMPKHLYYGDAASHYYIVGLDDGERKRLLVIVKESNDWEGPATYKTTSFSVLAYDLESGEWSEVNDFGGKTLFVGNCSSFWIEDTTRVIKGNCIYYTDDRSAMDFGCIEGAERYMVIYHLSEGTVEPHIIGESRGQYAPPIWLQSM